jgi:hypothetical protein
MKTFLLNKENKPNIPWGNLSDETYFIGEVPEGWSLAISPGNSNIIIVDVDNKNGKNGFLNIPDKQFLELEKTFNYYTKSGGKHYFLRYSGDKILMNTSTKLGLDLRIGSKANNAGGYVKYHHNQPIEHCVHLIKESSEELNKWLESLFTGVNYGKS